MKNEGNLFNHTDIVDTVSVNNLWINYVRRHNKSLCLLAEEMLIRDNCLTSDVLISIAIEIESFFTDVLFNIGGGYRNSNSAEYDVYRFKSEFVKKAIVRRRSNGAVNIEIVDSQQKELLKMIGVSEIGVDFELACSTFWLNSVEGEDEIGLKRLEDFIFFLYEKGKLPSNFISFVSYEKIDYGDLLGKKFSVSEAKEIYTDDLTFRDGFALTDKRPSRRAVTAEVEYCMICHERAKDSCSTGLRDKEQIITKNALGVTLEGCPLDEKISEAHLLRRKGLTIAALAMIVLDNPLCAGTGHRICNDCMKACIFQKQEPVNIPAVETGILMDVLSLPYGFEMYSLLTRWNPLNINCPFEKPYHGKKVLVVGMGPAGYTLSHYLLNEGFGVVGVDGLKIEQHPLTQQKEDEVSFIPIKSYAEEIVEKLDERIVSGFGGVSEYGITVRWDKNFLTTIQIMLQRRKNFRLIDGVRFGGTITVEDAWQLGFDHVAIATGAGKPTIINLKNNLSRGIRKASDFLMALQLTGAAKRESISNLQIQLPVVVIGGGLTAIDTATEALAYYPVQVEKILKRFEALTEAGKELDWLNNLDVEEKELADEFLAHAKMFRDEKNKAKSESREPQIAKLVQSLGGVTLYYRKPIQESPAYKLNHEEVRHALKEGIKIVENMNPIEAVLDKYGKVEGVKFQSAEKNEDGSITKEERTISAKSVFIAAGTSPNTMYEKEYPGTFQLDSRGNYFELFEVE